MIPDPRVVEVIFPGVPGPRGPEGPPGSGVEVTDDGGIVVTPVFVNFALIDGHPFYYPNNELDSMPPGTEALYDPLTISLSLIGV